MMEKNIIKKFNKLKKNSKMNGKLESDLFHKLKHKRNCVFEVVGPIETSTFDPLNWFC